MASDMAGQLQSGNACCKMWKEKYASLEYKRNALRQAVNILQPQIDRFQAENANLRKAVKSGAGKKEADEAKSKLASETLKFEQANKKLEAETEGYQERKRVESEMAKVEEQRKLAEANGKKVLQEKCRAENLSRQLEENRQSVEELQKEILEFVSSRNLAPGGQVDNKSNPEYEKMKDRLQSKISNVKVEEPKLVLELFKESKKRFEIEKQKAIDEKKRADLDIAKVEEQAKLVEWKEKYASLEYKRNALRQAVNILQPQIDRFQAENANLRKG
ncbi:hypothetical protein CFP56_004973 [Quercus suber]|uniref:Uncharacterized protein n=1 Tax=Quercus suber TaxID=58331 RepID=A0AAW0LAK2_QUESU